MTTNKDSLDAALLAAQEALRLARRGGYRREEALALRLLGGHALAAATPPRLRGIYARR